MKLYAKNPTPEDVESISNPAELVIQNPSSKTTKNMGKSKRKRDSKGRFMKKSKRSNPSPTDEFVDTGKNLFMQYGLAALAATGTVKGAQYIIGKVPVNIPQWAKEWLMIGGPAATGIIISMYADKKSAIAQGVAGGMVLASANGLSDKLINGNDSGGGMSDAKTLEQGDMIVKADGILYDQDGNAIARISGGESKQTTNELPAISSAEGNEHLLGEAWDNNSWETGETWEA